MSKSLSNGTLGLRFMQNALRRQQLQEVELIRAEVKDEGKWEVGQDVKEAWGIGPGTQRSDASVYESSYLPFLFSSEHEDTTSQASKPLGRRVFNKKGLDISSRESQSQPRQGADEPPADEDDPSPDGNHDTKDGTRVMKGRKCRVHANPMPISTVSLNNKNLKGFDTIEPLTEDALGSTRARDAIFSLGDVGTDLRSTKKGYMVNAEDVNQIQTPKKKAKVQNISSSTGFLKPVGVDEPVHPQQPPNDIIDGAREKKRPRDAADSGGEKTTKKNKNKRSMLSNSTSDVQ